MTYRDKLNSTGIELICQWIEAGKTQREIARDLGIDVSDLNRWLKEPDNDQHSARARQNSAESWLDRGLEAIEAALDKESGKDAGAARAYEQACARRAAQRNPTYRESQKVEVAGDPNRPLVTIIERRIVKADN